MVKGKECWRVRMSKIKRERERERESLHLSTPIDLFQSCISIACFGRREKMKSQGLLAVISIATVTLLLSVPEQSKGIDNAIYWSTEDGIYRTKTDGTGTQHLVTTNDEIWSIAIDSTAGKIYWTTAYTGKIRRSNLDGSQVEDILSGLSVPIGIALDSANGRMYWAENNWDDGYVKYANFDGSDMHTLYREEAAFGIALDTAAGKVYTLNSYEILRSNLDGSQLESVVNDMEVAYGFALDTEHSKVYWATTGYIEYANFDGSDRHRIDTNTENWGIALDLDADKIYLMQTPLIGGSPFSIVSRANLDGSSLESFISGNVPYLPGIAIGPVPEPASVILIGAGFFFARLRRKRS
jgi:hypothetical protein